MRYKINEDRVMFSPLGSEAVVFDREKNEYITLNETMFTIFKSISNNEDIDSIQKKLMDNYEVDSIACSNAIETAINSLVERGFVLVC